MTKIVQLKTVYIPVDFAQIYIHNYLYTSTFNKMDEAWISAEGLMIFCIVFITISLLATWLGLSVCIVCNYRTISKDNVESSYDLAPLFTTENNDIEDPHQSKRHLNRTLSQKSKEKILHQQKLIMKAISESSVGILKSLDTHNQVLPE